jgi:hypothetical protein
LRSASIIERFDITVELILQFRQRQFNRGGCFLRTPHVTRLASRTPVATRDAEVAETVFLPGSAPSTVVPKEIAASIF